MSDREPRGSYDNVPTDQELLANALAEAAESADDIEPVPHLVLELDGDRQSFPAFRNGNQFLLVKYADDLATGGFRTVRAVTHLAVAQVVPDQRGRLESYLTEHGSADDFSDHLYEQMERVWAGQTLLPLAQS